MYLHTQKAYALVGIVVVAVAIALGVLLLAAPAAVAGRTIGFLSLLVVFVGALVFSRMTVAIEAGKLTWHFAFGLIRKSIPLTDIAGAEPTRTAILDGWGIHLTSRGWLYNIWGAEAVWVKVRTGRDFLLGTDRAGELAQAIEAARFAFAEPLRSEDDVTRRANH